MKRKEIRYPFVPKSTTYLRPGQFWSIPLSNGRFACGRVVQLHYVNGEIHRRGFLAGLMDWNGPSPPTVESIAGKKVIEQGEAHIKTISENAGMILGLRPLELDAIVPDMFLDQGGRINCRVQCGFEILGRATAQQLNDLKVFSTWGYGVIKVLAELHFVKKAT